MGMFIVTDILVVLLLKQVLIIQMELRFLVVLILNGLLAILILVLIGVHIFTIALMVLLISINRSFISVMVQNLVYRK